MRTTVEEVRAVIDTQIKDGRLEQIMGIANRIVTARLGNESDLTVDELKDIETYLTAHLISTTIERQAKIEEIDQVRVEYQGKFGLGLDSTTYGQIVSMLDSTGKLAAGSRKQASIKATPQYPEDYD